MADKPQNDIFQTLAKIREKYSDSDDLLRIDADYQRIKRLFGEKGLAESEAMQELLRLCRRDVINARHKLATDKTLIGKQDLQLELWFVIEAREWLLKILSRDFDSELESIEIELQAELDR